MNKIKLYNFIIVLICVRTWLSISRIFESELIVVQQIFNVLIIIMSMYLYIVQKHNMKEHIISAILLLVFAYTSYIVKSQLLLFIPLVIIISKDINIRKTIKTILIVNMCFLIMHFLYYVICYFLEPSQINYVIDEDRIRVSFFLRHPNYAGAIILWSLAAYLYINEKYSILNQSIVIITAMIFAYFFTKSRTTLIGFVFLLIINIFRNKKLFKKWIRSITKYAFFILSILMIVMVINYSKIDFIETINLMLNGRLKLAYIGYLEYDYTWIGQYVNFSDAILIQGKYFVSKLIIDSFYLSCFINYGIIYLVAISFAIYKFCKRCSYKDVVLILLFILVSITEKYVIFPTIAFVIIILGNNIMYGKNKNQERKE